MSVRPPDIAVDPQGARDGRRARGCDDAHERFQRGLVVGKFCPLHLGHEYVIDTALARCDEVTVISYTLPEFERCDRDSRERWLAERFPAATRLVIDDLHLRRLCLERGLAPLPTLPHNDASDAEHRDFVGWLCRNLLETTVDAVFTSEGYGDGFADALTAYFAEQGGGPCVRHIEVDRARTRMPVSGTAIRRDPRAFLDWLSPPVRADFVFRIGLLGGESSGKTSLANALSRRLGEPVAAEYGRELWEARGGDLRRDDLLAIARTQVERERTLARDARRCLVCDTTPLTTLLYSRDMFDWADPELERLAHRPYDLLVLCEADFPFVQDGTRRDAAFRDAQQRAYLHELSERGLTAFHAHGPLAARVEAVIGELERRWERSLPFELRAITPPSRRGD